MIPKVPKSLTSSDQEGLEIPPKLKLLGRWVHTRAFKNPNAKTVATKTASGMQTATNNSLQMAGLHAACHQHSSKRQTCHRFWDTTDRSNGVDFENLRTKQTSCSWHTADPGHEAHLPNYKQSCDRAFKGYNLQQNMVLLRTHQLSPYLQSRNYFSTLEDMNVAVSSYKPFLRLVSTI